MAEVGMTEVGMTRRAGAKSGAGSTSERIIRAAYECFDRYGVSKTTIEDIAKRAILSRPSVYKYFSGKDDIVARICLDEAMKVNAEVRKRLVRTDKFDVMFTEAVLLVVKIGYENPYFRRTIEDSQYQANAHDSSSVAYRIHRELWRKTLEHAAATGELASDITIDDVIIWLNLSQHMLLSRIDLFKESDEKLRHFIRRFIAAPLLSQNRGTETGASAKLKKRALRKAD